MAKKKDDDVKKVVSIPLRSDLPAGTRFKFKGRKGLFEVKRTNKNYDKCDKCAFHTRERDVECSSVFCMPNFRADRRSVYIVEINDDAHVK